MNLIVSDLNRHFKNRKTANSFLDQEPISFEDMGENQGRKLASTEFIHSSFGSIKPIKQTASGISYGQPQFFSPVYTPMNWQIPSRRREVYMWNRFWYENEPRVATCIDFHSRFPISGFETECSNRYVKHYFDQLNKKLNIDKWARIISHEVHLLGDCFPFLEVDCDICGGSGHIGGQMCEHEGGSFKRLLILNPDFVEVFTNSIAPDDVITYVPDNELRDIVMKNGPGTQKLSNDVKKMIVEGRPVPLDNLCVSHLKYGESGYRRYGISMVRRLFPILSYKTKIMSAQWIVAERLILPIKVVKVGSDTRPASDADINAVQAQMMMASNDPNVCIVTHHAFDLDWYSGGQKVLQVQGEYEFINQEIMDGFGLNKAIITGEGPCYEENVEILTEQGWKRYTDVRDDEKLATFNSKTNALEYQHFKNRIVRDFDGELVNFTTNKIDMLVTPNHRMWVSPRGWEKGKEGYYEWKVVPAEEVKHKARMRACVDSWEGEIPDQYVDGVDFGGVKVELSNFMSLLGYYLSEGYAITERAAIEQKSGTDSCLRIESSLKSCGISFGKHENKRGMTVFRFYKPQRMWFVENVPGKAGEKKIPLWVKHLPVVYLRIILDALVDGDGSIHKKSKGKSPYIVYYSKSKQLADDVMEIAFKLGYSPNIRYIENRNLYHVNIPSSNIGKFPVLDTLIYGNSSADRRKCISRIPYTGKVWCFEVPNEFLIVRYKGKVLVCGNTYSSAAMGAEIMIRKLESWRLEIKRWIEEKIYLQVAKMRGFKEKNEWGEEEYIYPKIKWDSLNLRDRQNERQLLLSLYDKGLVSANRVLKEFDIDPDTEFEQIRYERIENMSMQQPGQVQGDAGGMGGGLGDLGGGGGGGGGLSMGGGEPSMGGAAEGMMGEQAGAPGGGAEMGGAPAQASNISGLTKVASEIADPMQFGGKILTQKTREKVQKGLEKQKRTNNSGESKYKDDSGVQRDYKGRVIMTSLEREILKGVEERQRVGQIQYSCYPSYEVKVGSHPVLIDLAFPSIKLAIEADGTMWHGTPEQKQRDQSRDAKLNNLGWIVIRFSESDIKNGIGKVLDRIISEIDKRSKWIQQQTKQLELSRKKDKLS